MWDSRFLATPWLGVQFPVKCLNAKPFLYNYVHADIIFASFSSPLKVQSGVSAGGLRVELTITRYERKYEAAKQPVT